MLIKQAVDTLPQFLVWLAAGGAVILLSWFTERWSWFQVKLTPDQRFWFHLIGSSVIALIAVAIQQFVPAEVLAQLQPYFTAIIAVVTLFMTNQIAHKNDPTRIY